MTCRLPIGMPLITSQKLAWLWRLCDVTCVWAPRSQTLAHVAEEDRPRAVRDFVAMWLAVYIARGRPSLNTAPLYMPTEVRSCHCLQRHQGNTVAKLVQSRAAADRPTRLTLSVRPCMIVTGRVGWSVPAGSCHPPRRRARPENGAGLCVCRIASCAAPAFRCQRRNSPAISLHSPRTTEQVCAERAASDKERKYWPVYFAAAQHTVDHPFGY
jgi:hypothetical protein